MAGGGNRWWRLPGVEPGLDLVVEVIIAMVIVSVGNADPRPVALAVSLTMPEYPPSPLTLDRGGSTTRNGRQSKKDPLRDYFHIHDNCPSLTFVGRTCGTFYIGANVKRVHGGVSLYICNAMHSVFTRNKTDPVEVVCEPLLIKQNHTAQYSHL